MNIVHFLKQCILLDCMSVCDSVYICINYNPHCIVFMPKNFHWTLVSFVSDLVMNNYLDYQLHIIENIVILLSYYYRILLLFKLVSMIKWKQHRTAQRPRHCRSVSCPSAPSVTSGHSKKPFQHFRVTFCMSSACFFH